MSARIWTVFPAAGVGSRFGGELPKQYRKLAGRCMIEWALIPFLSRKDIEGFVVALAPDDLWWPETSLYHEARISVVTGGSTRQLSVLAGLQALVGRAIEQDWVLVHDVARPCLTSALLQRLIVEVGSDAAGGLLALPVADTLKFSQDGRRCKRTVDRSALWRAQTPQMFRYGLLHHALERARDRELAVTDEAEALELLGYEPILVPGSESNLKVTRGEDLVMAERHLAAEMACA